MQLDPYPVLAFIFWISIQNGQPFVTWITSKNLDKSLSVLFFERQLTGIVQFFYGHNS